AAGPIMAALSGMAVGAATGGVVGGLVGLGIPEIEAKRYDEKLRKGNYLISAHADDDNQLDRAEEIFEAEGAEDISTVGEAGAQKAESGEVHKIDCAPAPFGAGGSRFLVVNVR